MKKELLLLSPTTWEDQNDAHYISRYREKMQLKSILVMCLTKAATTYHHWHVFAGNVSGVRIKFDETAFDEWASNIKGSRLSKVDYKHLRKAQQASFETRELPFVKRFAFRHEKEYRLVVDIPEEEISYKAFPFEFSMIKEIVINPWLPEQVFPSVEKAIRAASRDATFEIRRTTMLANDVFIEAGGE